jgi:hypothetical protein
MRPRSVLAAEIEMARATRTVTSLFAERAGRDMQTVITAVVDERRRVSLSDDAHPRAVALRTLQRPSPHRELARAGAAHEPARVGTGPGDLPHAHAMTPRTRWRGVPERLVGASGHRSRSVSVRCQQPQSDLRGLRRHWLNRP